MNARIQFQGKEFGVNFSEPIDISIRIKDGQENPNCYGTDPVAFESIRSENFIGSIREGGVVNHKKLHIAPHGNGTHTECYGHIVDTPDTITTCLTTFHFVGELVTLSPELQANGDAVITRKALREVTRLEKTEAIILRTLPNSKEKQTRHYTGGNPPYFDEDALAWMAESNINHLVTDLPSVDKEIDGGKLSAHHAFWNTKAGIRKQATITELSYIKDDIADGLYLINLQIISLEMDASPSKPILYKLEEVS